MLAVSAKSPSGRARRAPNIRGSSQEYNVIGVGMAVGSGELGMLSHGDNEACTDKEFLAHHIHHRMALAGSL